MSRKVAYKLDKWMTVRDRQVIVSVYYHGMLNSKQVEKLHFSGNKNSRIIALRRLKKMVDNDFLKCHWYGYNDRGSMQHFTITNKGAMIVSSEIEIDTSEIKINEATIISNIEHTSLIAEFHVALKECGYIVEKYTSDRLNKIEYSYANKSQLFEPDGKGIITSGISGRTFPFFLEMDRGTMSYNVFKAKVPKYERYYASKEYLKEFNKFPIVFIVTTSKKRMLKLKEIVEEAKRSDITYVFLTIKDFDKIDKEILLIAGRDGKYQLK